MPCVEIYPSSSNTQVEPGPPHEALFLVLAYLPVYELLTISQVCKSFRDAVNNDVFPWLHFVVDTPLNSLLSDQILIKLTSRANCKLRSLVLRNCPRITDDGLLTVIRINPLITKLHLQGCTSLTPNGIIRAAKTLSQNRNSLKSLRIHGILNLNKQHLQTLSSYLRTGTASQKPRPILYHRYTSSPLEVIESIDRLIDVDVCPRCNEIKLVFECSREQCRQKREQAIADCKGCSFCIPRCEECGGCIADDELEEAACSDILCGDCWLRIPKCNHCNKPYCKQHIGLQYVSVDSAGFVCEACRCQSLGSAAAE